MDLGGRPAGVEDAAHRRRREAVDGRAAARLHVGQQVQGPGDRGLQRARGDGGQVGLEQHVVDRLRQQRRERRGRPPRRRRRRARARRWTARPARRRRAARPRSGSRPPAGPGRAAGAGAPTPRGPPARGARCRWPGPRRRAAPPARPGPSAGSRPGGCWSARAPARWRCGRRSRRRGRRPAPGVRGVASHAATRSSQRSAVARVAPHVEAVGGQPHAVALGGQRLGEQAGGRGDLDQQRRRRLVHVQVGGRRLEVAHPEPAAAQGARRSRRPSGRAAARRVVRRRRPRRPRSGRPGRTGRDVGDDGRARRRPARVVVRPPRSASPTSPGTCTSPSPRGTSSRWASSSSAGVAAVPGRTSASAAPVLPVPPCASTCSSRARAAGEISASRAVDLLRPRRTQALAGERLDPADARGRATREALRDAGERAYARRAPPRRRPGRRAAPARPARRRGRRGTSEVELVRGGLTRHHEGIKNSELEAVQPVERARQRGARGGAGREMRGVVRGGSGEIGTIPEQPGQALVRPGPELVRQRPVPVHRGEATPAARPGRPSRRG